MALRFEDLLAFVEAVQRESLSKAAEALRLNQPAITRRIQNLEELLDAPLLDRNTRPLRPTAAGWRVFEKCQLLLAQLEELQQAPADKPGRRPLHLGVAHVLAEGGISRLLETFQPWENEFDVRLTAGWGSTLLDQVARGTLDAAVVASRSLAFPVKVRADRLMTFEVVAVSQRGQYPAGNGALTLRDIAHCRWITNPEGCGFRAQLEQSLGQIGAPLQIAVDTFGTEAQLDLVAHGVGLGLAPLPFVQRSRFRNRVDVLALADFSLSLDLYLVRSEKSEGASDALEAFAASVVAQLEDPSTGLRRQQTRGQSKSATAGADGATRSRKAAAAANRGR